MMSLAGKAQITNQNTRLLSLRECFEMALVHNLNIRIDRYSPEIARYNLQAAYGVYDPILSFNASSSYLKQPGNFDPKKFTQIKPTVTSPTFTTNVVNQDSPYEQAVDSFGPALAGALPMGLAYNLFARSDHFDATSFPLTDFLITQTLPNQIFPPATNVPNTNNYFATVGLTLSQPLLKDFWIDLNRRNIQLHKKNLKISELTLQEQLMRTVTTVATNYFNLMFAREEVSLQTAALEAAKRLLDDTRRKVQGGALPPLDQQQVESSVETIQTALFSAEQNYDRQQNMLKNLLTDNYQAWMDVTIAPSENLTPIVELPPNRSASWANALLRRPEVLQLKLDLEKLDINLRFTHNQLFPSLNLVGSYGWASQEHTFSQTLSGVAHGSFPFYSVAVVFSIPLGDTTARNEHKAAKLAKSRGLLQFQRLQNAVINEVDTAVKLTETTFKQVASTRKAREFAEAALASVQRQYEAGTLTSYFVVDQQRLLTRAQFGEIRALADYNIALARLALSEGTTLEKNHVALAPK